MAMFMTRFNYSPETWAHLRQRPEDRSDAVRQSVEAVGGRLHGLWYAIGAFDGICLWEAPSRVAAVSSIAATIAAGAHSRVETTVLLSVEEVLEALRQSAVINYQAPGVARAEGAGA